MGQKATILIVDKEKILVDLLVRALTSPDLSVFGTTSADEGARLVDVHGPDLLVIDPSIQNGLPLMSSVRSGQFKAKIVAVAGDDESRERLKAFNVVTIVDRNAGWEGLVAAIRAALPVRPRQINIDLSEVRFVDCGGLGALIAVRNCARRRNSTATVKLLNPALSTRWLLKLTRADSLFPIERS